jgi:hypothetical protein
MKCHELREEILNQSFERIIQYIKNNHQTGKVELKLSISNRYEIQLYDLGDHISLLEEDFNSLCRQLAFAGYNVETNRYNKKACTFKISGW